MIATVGKCDKIKSKLFRRARRSLRQRLRKSWSAARRPRPDRWCRRSLRLDRATENSTTTLDLTNRPWWRKILAAIVDPAVRSVTVQASTQVGKTLTLIAAILYCAEHDPAPAMVVLPDEQSAIEFRDRIYANAAASLRAGTLENVTVPPRSRWNTRAVDLGSMRVYLAWSQARQRLRGRPCRRVFLSEIDVYEGDKRAGDPVSQSHQRTKAFWRFLHYHESSPTEHPSPIAGLEQAAEARYRWHCPCPYCGHKQEVRFFAHEHAERKGRGGVRGYRDASGELLSTDVARREAYYCCEACDGRIEQPAKHDFMTRGEWVEITNRDTSEPPRSLGFHLWTAHSETMSWGDIAASYVEASEDGKLRDWWGNTLGLPYRPKSRVAPWHDVGTRLAWSNPRGFVPPEAWFLTAGLDVQGDANGCRYVVRAWAPERTSWLVDWGWIERGGDDVDAGQVVRQDLRRAGELILDSHYPIHGGGAAALGGGSLAVRLLCVDTGHAPKKVHEWMRSLPPEWTVGEGSERVRAVKGDPRLGSVRFQRSVVEKNVRTGEEYEGGMALWRLSVWEMYPDFCERLFALPGKDGSWHVTSDALTLGKAYLQQITNLERRIRVHAKTGAKIVEWAPRNHQIPVDFLDAEIYAEFAAEMVVGSLGWSRESLEAWRDRRSASGKESRRTERRASYEDLSDR